MTQSGQGLNAQYMGCLVGDFEGSIWCLMGLRESLDSNLDDWSVGL